MTTKQNVVISTKDGAPASKILKSLANFLQGARVTCCFKLPKGETILVGKGKPLFTVVFHSTTFLLKGLTELNIGRAYTEGKFDVQGDVAAFLSLRKFIKQNALIPRLKLNWKILFSPVIKSNKKAIKHHYSFDDEFFYLFTDKKYHMYSQCIYKKPTETLEQAAVHKLETMYNGLKLKKGMRLLDIGGGWGGATRYCVPRGIDITSLTIADNSKACIQKLIDEEGWQKQARVYLEDFFNHKPKTPYDAIVIYGVIEHIPYYQRFAAKIRDLLKPGGRVYLDGSATHEKYDLGDFGHTYIYPGQHCCMCLQDVIREFLFHGMEIKEVIDERWEYALTIKHWAERFEMNRDKLVAICGEESWRAFHLYLWATHKALENNTIQAYHIIAEKNASEGPRPKNLKRIIQFIRERASR